MPRVDLDYDSDNPNGAFNCATFRLNGAYCPIQPTTATSHATQIVRPGHHNKTLHRVDECAHLYFPMENDFSIPIGYAAQNKVNRSAFNANRPKSKIDMNMSDDDIVDSFGPSRLHRRILFRLPGARKAAGKEIADLLTPHGAEPPEVAQVSSGDSRFRSAPYISPR